MTKPTLNWISFGEALGLVMQRYPAAVSAYEVVIEAISEGRLSVRGTREKLTASTGYLLGMLASARRSGSTAPFDFEVGRNQDSPPLRMFENEVDWQEASWKEGIVVEDPNDTENYAVFSNLFVKEKDFLSYMADRFRWSSMGLDGRPKKSDAWLALAACLIRLERVGLLNQARFNKPADLTKKLISMCDDQLDPKTIRKEIKIVHAIFVSGYDGQRVPPQGEDDNEFDLYDALRAARLKLEEG